MSKGRIEYRRNKPPRYYVDGGEVSESEYKNTFPDRDGVPVLQTNDHWRKFKSDYGLGVHSSQAEEFNKQARDAGLTGVHYDETGVPHISSREQRKKLLKVRGVVDNDGGYGD